jgi:hypothetical protein
MEERTMAILRGTVIKQSLIGILLMAAYLMVSVAGVKAETLEFTIVSYIIKNERIEVGDVEEHFIGVHSMGGLAFFENGEMAIYQGCEMYDSDFPNLKISYEGYFQLTYGEGSTSMFKFRGTATTQLPWWFSHGRVWVEGTGEYIKGSKRFEGIQGSMSFSGRGFTAYQDVRDGGDLYMVGTMTYTLPSK